jgi:SAM-dependent methyltransferase
MNEFTWLCPLCESDTSHHHFFFRVIAKLWVKNYIPVPVMYAICDECGLVFQWYRMDESEMTKYYAGQYRATVQGGDDDVTDRVLTEQTARVKYLLPELPFESVKKHLDIGASTGLFMQAIKDKYECETLGIEPGEKYRYYAKKNGLKILSDLDVLHKEHENAFDLITIIHVLEHLVDPVRMLVRLHDYIAKDGRLLIEVPHLYFEHSLNLSHPVAFTADTLKETLSRSGWNIEWIKQYDGFKIGRPHPSNILVCATPGEVSDNKVYVDCEDILRQFNEYQQELADYDVQRQAAQQAK